MVEFGAVERYSHVWHIVSTVQGDVAAGRDAFDVLPASVPGRHAHRRAEGAGDGAASTSFEPVRRGIYGGAVGYLDAAGDLDMAIAIRTAVMIDGVAHVQASAGIVADSVPAAGGEGDAQQGARGAAGRSPPPRRCGVLR